MTLLLPIIIVFSIYAFYFVIITYQIFKILRIYNRHKRREDISEAHKFFMFRRNDLQHWRCFKKLEFYLSAIFLLPTRLTLLILSSLNLIILIKIFSYLKKFYIVRVFIRWNIRVYSRLMLFLAGFYYIKTTHMKLTNFIANYQENQKSYYPLIVCNHISWVESVFLMSKFSGSFIAKNEFEKMPIISHIGVFLDLLYIDRSNGDERQQILRDIGERVKKKNEIPLIIFPEGTTSNGTALLTFKKGSFYFMNPLKIICIKYPRKNFNPFLDDVTGMGTNVLLSFCQFYNSMEVVEFDVLEPKNLENVDKWEDYAKVVRMVMGQCLKIKQVEMGYRDSLKYGEFLMNKKGKKTKKIRSLEKILSNS